jgi:chemotaxis protein histidine kinase CheA
VVAIADDGGQIQVTSQPGHGTRLDARLPTNVLGSLTVPR